MGRPLLAAIVRSGRHFNLDTKQTLFAAIGKLLPDLVKFPDRDTLGIVAMQ